MLNLDLEDRIWLAYAAGVVACLLGAFIMLLASQPEQSIPAIVEAAPAPQLVTPPVVPPTPPSPAPAPETPPAE